MVTRQPIVDDRFSRPMGLDGHGRRNSEEGIMKPERWDTSFRSLMAILCTITLLTRRHSGVYAATNVSAETSGRGGQDSA